MKELCDPADDDGFMPFKRKSFNHIWHARRRQTRFPGTNQPRLSRLSSLVIPRGKVVISNSFSLLVLVLTNFAIKTHQALYILLASESKKQELRFEPMYLKQALNYVRNLFCSLFLNSLNAKLHSTPFTTYQVLGFWVRILSWTCVHLNLIKTEMKKLFDEHLEIFPTSFVTISLKG